MSMLFLKLTSATNSVLVACDRVAEPTNFFIVGNCHEMTQEKNVKGCTK